MDVVTRDGDTVDEICWRHYGKTQGVTEQVYEANPGLCELGAIVPAGRVIHLPAVADTAQTDTLQLWD
ncbi:tail protein X [Gibbsiella dentisursi]|uniref:Tail protein X n=1 Tax=Gibbsiella dentisursi TaxID=796890 RepID=A0ABP7M1I3_9GAMM